MSSPRSINPYLAIATWPGWTREATLGFIYWVAFLLMLEPDNLLRASQAGHPLRLGNEVMRILVASLLGAAVTPALLTFSRRFPMHGPTRVRNALIHSAGMSGLALLLIVVSCFLAAWGFYGMWLPSLADIESELVSNWLLLIYALAALTALAHAGRWFRQRTESLAAPAVSPDYLTHVEVKARGRTRFVNIQEVDWIETQIPSASCACTGAPSSRLIASAKCSPSPTAMRCCVWPTARNCARAAAIGRFSPSDGANNRMLANMLPTRKKDCRHVGLLN